MLKGNVNDKAFQKRTIEKFINSVYLYDNRTVVYFTFDNAFISKAITDQTIKDITKPDTTEGSGSVSIGGPRIQNYSGVRRRQVS